MAINNISSSVNKTIQPTRSVKNTNQPTIANSSPSVKGQPVGNKVKGQPVGNKTQPKAQQSNKRSASNKITITVGSSTQKPQQANVRIPDQTSTPRIAAGIASQSTAKNVAPINKPSNPARHTISPIPGN